MSLGLAVSSHKKSIMQCHEKHISSKPIRLRLIRVKLKKETEILVTNLADKKKYPVKIFKDLYHLRWGVEENYKRQKRWLEIENFTGKSELPVRQDFHAKIVSLNLTAVMVFESQKHVDKNTASSRHKYKINFAQALSKMKDTVILLIQNIDLKERLARLLIYLSETVETLRHGRSYARKVNNKNLNINHLNYKRCK